MMKTLRIARLRKMPPPWSDVEAVRKCAVEQTEHELTVDLDSDCYRALLGKPPRLKGVGDVIAKVTKAVGIRECGGCAQRRAWLNRKLPFKP